MRKNDKIGFEICGNSLYSEDGGMRIGSEKCKIQYPHQESNLDFSLRRGMFYPLNYEDRLQLCWRIINFQIRIIPMNRQNLEKNYRAKRCVVVWSGIQDSNLQPRQPECRALANCANPRFAFCKAESYYFTAILSDYLIKGPKKVFMD